MKRQIAKSGEELFLGYAGENAVTEVAFLIADKRSEYGEGQAEVLARRPYQGYCTPVPTRVEGDYVIWTPTKEDLSASGCGEVQMLYYVGRSCKRTEIFRTRINRSLGTEEPSENPGSGKPGGSGLSAYELAVQQGFVGTLDEWLASLEGEPGKDAVVPKNVSAFVNDAGYQTEMQVRQLINQSGGNVGSEAFDDVNITDIAPYYRHPVVKAVKQINDIDENTFAFVVVTDTHEETNANNSQNIIRYLLKNSKATRLFHLGDQPGNLWSKDEYEAYMTPLKKCKPQVYVALGNHERFASTSKDVAVIYEDFLKDKTELKGNPQNFYYYFDDDGLKVRFMVINTSDNNGNSVSGEQLTWIRQNVQLPDNTWKLCVFGHIDIVPNDSISDQWNSNKAREVVDAIDSTNGTVIGYFCGHEHFDRISDIEGKFHQVQFICDTFQSYSPFPEVIDYPKRQLGTITEQAISVVEINTVTGDVIIKRIGAGEDMNYKYKQTVEPPIPTEKTYTITNNLTNVKNSNVVTFIKEKTAYTGKLTADKGFTLDGATVTVTMGGANITSTAYSNGNINIPSVTGNIVITANAVKVEVPPKPPIQDGIVTNGLVFRLDGKNRGGQTGHWIDTIGGKDYVLNNVTETEEGVRFYNPDMKYSSFGLFEGESNFPETYTIEVAYNSEREKNLLLYLPKKLNNNASADLLFGIYNGEFITTTNNLGKKPVFTSAETPTGKHTVSITYTAGFDNKKVMKAGAVSYFVGQEKGSYLTGNGSSKYAFTGTVYEIRIYNRELSEEEILHNQQHDIDTYFDGTI